MNPKEAVKVLERHIEYHQIHSPNSEVDQALRYVIHCCKVVKRIEEKKIESLINLMVGQNEIGYISFSDSKKIAQAIVRELKGEGECLLRRKAEQSVVE